MKFDIFMLRPFLALFIWIFAFIAFGSSITPLPFSYGALIYDLNCTGGPGKGCSTDYGQWVNSLSDFNAGAASGNKLTRFYPYSSDIEITCSDPSNITTCSISPGYVSGNQSVAAYYNAFPNAQIMPIVDVAQNYLNNKLLLTNTTMADNVASALVTQLCADSKVAGVFFDLEVSNGLSNPGIFEFYRQMSNLLASSACIDATHPKGRYMGVYITPVNNDWQTLQAAFGSNNNSYIAIPLYDVSAFTTPPTPNPLSAYTSYLTSVLANASSNSQKFKVPYSTIVPAGASFGTFQQYGIYNASEPGPTYFQLITDFGSSNATQLLFVQTARGIACKNINPYFMGQDYWSWNQYVNSGANADGTLQLTMPNIPDAATVSYLQNIAPC